MNPWYWSTRIKLSSSRSRRRMTAERKDRVRRTYVGFSSGSLKDSVEQKPTALRGLFLIIERQESSIRRIRIVPIFSSGNTPFHDGGQRLGIGAMKM